jgi:hypothetical protein
MKWVDPGSAATSEGGRATPSQIQGWPKGHPQPMGWSGVARRPPALSFFFFFYLYIYIYIFDK